MSINAVTYLTGNTTFETGMVKRGTMGFNVKPTLSGSFNWWNKVDALSTQYLIYTDSYTTERTTQANAIPTCWSTPDLNDTSFVNLVNTIPERIGQLPFTAFAPAYNWLTGTNKYVVMKNEYENIVTDSLVLNLDAGWYNSYPGSGTVWTDLSSTGNNGTLINGPAFQSNGQGSLYFDNTDDYVRVNESASVDITSNQISFGAWVYPTVSNKYQHILVKNVGESRQYGMWLSVNGTSQIFRNLNGVVTQTNVAISTPWVVNQWNHIYLVYNGSTIKIYLNGLEVFTENASGNIVHTNSNVNIGGEPSQAFFLNGNIGSAQIYNIALTPNQILQNYNTQKYRFGYTPPFTQDGLALYLDAANPASYPGNGTTWYDLSDYTRNGTLVNGVGFSSLNGGYLIFDGSDDYISNISNTGLNHGTDNFSYFAWVNLQGKPSLGTIFENGSWTSCLLIRYETNVITIYSMGQYWGAFSFNPSLDTWNHLGFVRNGNFIDFYVNGVYQTALGFTANIAPSPNIFIGTSQHATNQCFNGYISVAQIYTRALTTTEITEIFNYQKNRYGL
jgi:hypothetical protein